MTLLTVKELAEKLRVKEQTCRTYIKRKMIPEDVIFKIGTTIRFKSDAVDKWLNT